MIEGTKLLVVDDNLEILELLADFLSLNGCDVKKARTGKDALKIIEKGGTEIALVDIGLPDADGLTLTDEIKKRDPSISVVIFTGKSDVNVAVDAMKRGASDFLTKPLDFEKLLLTLFRVSMERKSLFDKYNMKASLEDKKRIEILNRELQNKIKELTMMYRISTTINSIKISDNIFERLLNIINDVLNPNYVGLYLVEDERKLTYYKGPIEEPLRYEIAVKEEEIKRYLLSGKHVLKNDDLYMPLIIKGECFGVVRTGLAGRRDIEADIFLLRLVLENSSTQIENRMLYESLFESVIQTLRSLISAINKRDLYTEEHCKRVTEMSLAIAEKAELSEYEKDSLRIAAPIHDVGKIGIPDHILLKPGKLTVQEYTIMKNHSVIGEEILNRFDILSKESEIIRHHHERFDGRGYPDGLKGDDIPLPVKIIAIADAFDAMITDRPYRRAMTIKEAREEIRRCSGTQFDPYVVELFERILKNGEG